MIAYPLRVFSAIVVGLQDVTFNGGLAIGQSVLNIAITAAMLLAGYGLYAPATGAAVADPRVWFSARGGGRGSLPPTCCATGRGQPVKDCGRAHATASARGSVRSAGRCVRRAPGS